MSGDNEVIGNKAVEGLLLCIVIVFSIVGNLSLWIVVLRSKALRTVTSMFILGLSMADLLVATVNMPLTVFTIIKGDWMFSDSLCMAFGFINMMTLVGSVLSLCNISINRYFMVCRPAKFKDIYTTRNAILMVTATVTTTILLSSLPLIGWSKYVYTPTHSFCFADWINYRSYAYFMISCCFGIPLSVMTFCNISIIRSVRASRRKVKSTYRTTMSTTVYSTNDDESQKEHTCKISENDITVTTKSTHFESSSSIETCLSTERDNNNIHIERSGETSDTGESKCECVSNCQTDSSEDKIAQHGQNLDCISVDSSNESNTALISQIRRQRSPSPRRNQLFSNDNQNKEKIQSIHQTRSAKEKNENVDNNYLHPTWKSKELDTTADSSATQDTTIDSVKEIDTKSKPQYTKSVKLRSPVRVRRREEVRLAVSLIVVVVLFVICWLPYCISMLISIHYSGYIPREFHMFTLLIGYANSGCNPIVYGIMNQRFKVGFKRLFCFWKSHVLTLSSNS